MMMGARVMWTAMTVRRVKAKVKTKKVGMRKGKRRIVTMKTIVKAQVKISSWSRATNRPLPHPHVPPLPPLRFPTATRTALISLAHPPTLTLMSSESCVPPTGSSRACSQTRTARDAAWHVRWVCAFFHFLRSLICTV
jgi:hypothetical protein